MAALQFKIKWKSRLKAAPTGFKGKLLELPIIGKLDVGVAFSHDV